MSENENFQQSVEYKTKRFKNYAIPGSVGWGWDCGQLDKAETWINEMSALGWTLEELSAPTAKEDYLVVMVRHV